MIALSRDAGYERVLVPGISGEVKLGDGFSVPQVKPGVRVKFQPLERIPVRRYGRMEMDWGFETSLFPTRDGRARGILYLEAATEHVNEVRAQRGEDPITEERLVEILKALPEYGTEFVILDEETQKEVQRSAETSQDFIRTTDAGYMCELCQVGPITRGISGHIKSKVHQEKLATARGVSVTLEES